MTGLDKIINCIDEEANLIAKKIIDEAKLKSEKIIADAEKTADNKAELIIKNAEEKANFILKRSMSLQDLKERELILNAKREQISYILDETKKFLISLPDKEYFEIVLKLCKKYLEPFKCKIIFSKLDLKRLTPEFKNNLLELARDVGADLKISEKTKDISGGFILSYGDIEENCSFDALFESKFDLLSDKVNELLFS